MYAYNVELRVSRDSSVMELLLNEVELKTGLHNGRPGLHLIFYGEEPFRRMIEPCSLVGYKIGSSCMMSIENFEIRLVQYDPGGVTSDWPGSLAGYTAARTRDITLDLMLRQAEDCEDLEIWLADRANDELIFLEVSCRREEEQTPEGELTQIVHVERQTRLFGGKK